MDNLVLYLYLKINDVAFNSKAMTSTHQHLKVLNRLDWQFGKMGASRLKKVNRTTTFKQYMQVDIVH